MKKTPFLSYILAALLACSVVPQALASSIRIDCDTKDKELDVDDDVGWDCTWDDDREMWFSNYQLELYADCSIINGGWSAPIYISDGITLTLAEARDWEELKSGELLYWSNDIDMADLDDDEILMINMRDGSTLDYRNNDLWLGQMSFAGKSMYGYDPTVNLKCNDLVTVSICNRTRDFSIDAHIHFINASSRLRIEAGTNAVFLNCDQDINLAVDKNDAIYMTDGRFISGYGYRTRLNGATLNLPNNATSKIEGYLCGTSTITLGDGTTVQGRNVTSGSYQYFSWLLNDIEVRENCIALMTAGYYGGNITMQKGSSLKFDMLVAPAGVDEEHWNGGVKVDMNGGNTLDLAGKQTTLDLTVTGQENKNTLQNGTFAGTAVITDGSLALLVNMDPNTKVTLQGAATLDLEGQKLAFGLTVTGDKNKLANGAFIGTLTLEENSYLYSDSAMTSWGGPTAIVMNNGSRLEMATGPGKDRWINDVSKLEVNGEATVVNAYLRIKPGETYTLGNGVQNLVGEGRSFLSLDNSTLDLGGDEISKLDIGVWSAFEPYNNVIKNGTLNTYVEIDPSAKLWLDGVTLGDNASFTMGNNTQLNMGGASIKLSKITLAAPSTATVDNGMLDLGAASYTLGIADAAAVIHLDQNHALQLGAGAAVSNGQLCLPGGTNDTPMDYTLNLQGGETSSPAGSGVTLNLGEDVTFATNHNTRFLLNEESIGNPDCPVNINVTASGRFILGDSSRDQTVYGDVNLTHTGDGPAATPGAYDVEMNYRLIGNLTAEMNGRSINIGNIGDDRQDTHPGTATVNGASDATVGSFTGEALTLIAEGAVTFNGAVAATADSVVLEGASVSIGGSLAANNGSANITSTASDISITGTLSALESNVLESAADITIGGNVTGGALTATAAQSITLQAITIGDNAAALTATNGSITAAAFTGGSLTAKAAEAVTINGDVASRNNTTLSGASVGVNGSITTLYGRTLIASTGEAIVIGGTLSSGTSSTLDSAGNITLGTLDGDGNIISGGDVIHGALTATAANSIKLKDIIIGTNDAELTATGGSITAGAFAGANLEANAKGAVTFNGDVEASGTDEWQISTDEDAPTYAVVLEGSGVSVNGSLTASADQNYVKSTGGDINITGTLNAALSSTLDSAGNITLGGNVIHGALTASAAQSIQLKDISINANNAALTATGGSITAGDVTAGLLTATAAGTITLNDVAVSQSEAQIVSTGEGGNVVLNAFNGGGALIKATHGSITVATRVTGSASTNKNTFTAAGSVTFNGATGDNNLEHAIIKAPQVNWSNGTTLKDVTVSHWAPPANSPLMLLAAGNGVPQATLTVNGFLELTESSTVNGNVVINKQDNIIPAVTVDHSTITGRVSGATELVLNRGSVGSVARGEYETLTVASSGASAITALPDALTVDNLTLNGGSLTVCNQDETSSMGQLLVSSLTVQHNTTLDSNMMMKPGDGQESSSIIFNLSAENEATALLSMSGSLTAYARAVHGQSAGKSNISITLNGDASVEGGKRYALITLASGQKPTFWNEEKLNLAVSGLTQKPDDLFWIDGTLYFQNGGELTRAVWSPVTSHQWNTTDLNWLQDGYRYRYKDGVTVVFDDTAFQHDSYKGEVELMNNGDGFMPGDVQVENIQGHNYTFRGDGKIAGTTKLTKDGDGTLTIENANSYSGGTTIHAGTLVVDNEGALGSGNVTLESGIQEEGTQEGGVQAGDTPEGGTLLLRHNGYTSSFDMVTLQCGTVQIANGAKSFNLTVTGKNTRLEGTWDDAFTGTLTMKVGSRLFAAGGVLSAVQRNHIDQIVMENGSTLALPAGDDANCRIWINNISVFNVYEGTDKDAPRLEGAYLCIDPGGTYTLGATTGDNINSLQNLRGDNSTAFLLDGSTLNLNRQTDRLNIIVRKEQEDGESYITTGEINANVRIYNGNTLRVDNVRIGNNTSIVMDARANMIMSGVAIDAGVTFSMADEAYLDLGGTFALPTSVSLGAFTFTGASATIDNGSLYVERKETGVPLKLGTNLSGTDTVVSLHEEASLDLGGNSLAVTEVKLDTAAASATIGNGMVDSALAVASGKTLHLGDPLEISGAVTGGGTLVKDTGGIVNITGSMVNFTGNLVVQGGFFNLLNTTSLNNMADVTINKGTLGLYKEETPAEKPATANEGTLTITGGHKLTAGRGTTLNANLVLGGGNKARATLDVHAMAGKGGLQMGSTVTLTPGLVLLSEEDMDGVNALRYMGKYDLFYSVDGLSLDGTPNYLAELGLADSWVKAADVFANDMFKHAEEQYYVFYSGANQAGGAGGNVGTVYIMQVPEPTTSTLSLLALAALAARRRK